MKSGLKIGVLMGGESAERDVSLRSGEAVLGALLKKGYDAVSVDAAVDVPRRITDAGIGAAFIALHGGSGENGAIQGMLEVMGIPYTGSGVLSSALAMDKLMSKKLFAFDGLDVPAFRVLHKEGSRALDGMDLPLVIKPSTEGSSIGVSIVRSHDGLEAALESAFSYCDTVLVEEYIVGKEVQIAIFRDRPLGGVEVRPGDEFYSYRAKYTGGMTEYVLPPELGEEEYERAKQAALAAHRALGCSGATRVDLIVDAKGRAYVLEVNTIPGMTETSLLPKIAATAGLDFATLVEEILLEALDKDGQDKE